MLGVNRAEFNGEENFRINTNPLSEKRCKWENQNSLKMASQAYRELLSHFRVVIGILLSRDQQNGYSLVIFCCQQAALISDKLMMIER